MAAILISDCTVSDLFTNGFKVVKIVTPATADDGDTIDVSSLFQTGCFSFVSGSTDGSVIDATAFSTTITIPGATDNQARTIMAFGL